MVTYPAEWKECSFEDTGVEVLKGQIITKANVKEGKVPVIAGGMEPAYYCDKYNRDGLTITISASGANAGYVNLYKGKIFASDCSTISEAPNYDVRYIYYLLLNKQNEIYDAQTGGAQPHIHPKDIYKLPIVFTSDISEQHAIAYTLSTFDEHIENLTNLIEKKKAIRDGALEDLISGKVRLDGFKDELEEITLENLCIQNGLVRGPFGGSLKKDGFVLKGIKVYEQKNAIEKDFTIGSYFVDEAKYLEMNRFEVNPGDFILSCSGTIGELYQLPKNAPVGIINQALLKIKVNERIVIPEYFEKVFNYRDNKNKIIDDTQGGAMKNLVGMDKFRKTKFLISRNLLEQQAIASVLTAMDDELNALEQERNKIMQIKAGAMDDLLSGKVRLV